MPDPITVTGMGDVVGMFVGSGGGTVGGGALVWYLMHKRGMTQETSDINALDKRLSILETRTMDKLESLSQDLKAHRREEDAFRAEAREWRETVSARFSDYDRNIASFYRNQARGDVK